MIILRLGQPRWCGRHHPGWRMGQGMLPWGWMPGGWAHRPHVRGRGSTRLRSTEVRRVKMLVLHLSVGQEAGSVPGTHSWEGLQVEHPVKGQKEGHCDNQCHVSHSKLGWVV